MSESCPSEVTLVRFWQGSADEATLEHISTCESCSKKVDEIQRNWQKQIQADVSNVPRTPPGNAGVAKPTVEQSLARLAVFLQTSFECDEVRFVSKGGQSAVFEATKTTDEGEKRFLAKIVDAQYVAEHLPQSDARRMKERLKREYRIAKELNHENIYRVRHFREEGPTSVLWMERVQGKSLHELGKNVRFTLDDVYSLLKQLAQALDYNAKRNIVHRDLSPSNIIYDEQTKRFVLIDFGMAKKLPSAVAETTSFEGIDTVEGARMGTPGFVSDEQWNDASTALCPTDIFSLARVALWMLSSPEGRTEIEKRDKNYRMPSALPAALKSLFNDMLSPSQFLRPDPVALLERVAEVERMPQGNVSVVRRRSGLLKGVFLMAICAIAVALAFSRSSGQAGQATPTVRVDSLDRWNVADDEFVFTSEESVEPGVIEFGEFQNVEIEFAISCEIDSSVTVFGPTTGSQVVALVMNSQIPFTNRLVANSHENGNWGSRWQRGMWRQVRLRVAADGVSAYCADGTARAALEEASLIRIAKVPVDKGTIGLRIESKLARLRDLKITDLQSKQVIKGLPKAVSQTNSIFLKLRP